MMLNVIISEEDIFLWKGWMTKEKQRTRNKCKRKKEKSKYTKLYEIRGMGEEVKQ